jgi:regulator of protease activity HflC (stomatin/prohibitin superfamily)
VNRYSDNPFSALVGGVGCLAVAVVGILFLLLFSIKFVGAGEIGVATNFGAVNHEERGPGVNLVLPFFTDIVTIDGRIQGVPFENLGAASKEYQDVFLTGTLNYHIQFDRASELYQTVGLDYRDKLIVPFYANIVKEVVPQYAIGEVLPKREEIRRLTVEKLQAKLQPYGIVVDDVALSQIDFNEEYNAAIQDKQVQELRVQTERNILEQKKITAQQAVIAAQGEANAQIERARGEAEANRLISASLTEEILQNRYIEKLSDKVQVMMVPSGGDFIFDTKGLINPPQQ